jgi:hypothetical protein
MAVANWQANDVKSKLAAKLVETFWLPLQARLSSVSTGKLELFGQWL